MPWNIKCVIGERCRLVKALLRNDKSVVALCRFFGVSRKTAYKWKARFLQDGRRGLRDRKRAPRRRPGRLSPRWIGRLKRLRQRQPSWGPKKLRAHFLNCGLRPPSVRTIGRWLGRLKLTRPRSRRPRKTHIYQARVLTRATRPNQVWTVDFKGWFRAGNASGGLSPARAKGQKEKSVTYVLSSKCYPCGVLVPTLTLSRWEREQRLVVF